jgi:hypothetical protein
MKLHTTMIGSTVVLLLGVSATASAQTYGFSVQGGLVAPRPRPVVVVAPPYGSVPAPGGWVRPAPVPYYRPAPQVIVEPYPRPIGRPYAVVGSPYAQRPGFVWVEGYWQNSASGPFWVAAHWQAAQPQGYVGVAPPCPTQPGGVYGSPVW